MYLREAFKGQELPLLSSSNLVLQKDGDANDKSTGNVLAVEDLHEVLVHTSVNSITMTNQSN